MDETPIEKQCIEGFIAGRLAALDWNVLRRGWPDLLCWRRRERRLEVMAIECKDKGDFVRPEQAENHLVLKAAGINVRIFTRDNFERRLHRPGRSYAVSSKSGKHGRLAKLQQLQIRFIDKYSLLEREKRARREALPRLRKSIDGLCWGPNKSEADRLLEQYERVMLESERSLEREVDDLLDFSESLSRIHELETWRVIR